jgi:cephalosporin hydroxylase
MRLRSLARSLRRRPPNPGKSLRTSATVRRFHRLYYENAARTWQNTRWLEVRVAKCPLDLWVYQEILTELRPELVIETGTFAGGSALFLASCMDVIGCGRVITVDIEEHDARPHHDRITYVTGSSVDPALVDRLRHEAEATARVMVILDSDHARDHVLAELRAYSPLVTPGSYLVVEDTNINGRPVFPTSGPGPHEAVEAFLRETRAFERDQEREKFFMTFNPGGFLRRLDDPA